MLKVIPTSEIFIGDRAREDMGDIISLASSIAETGLIQPLAVRQLVAPVEVDEDGTMVEKKYELLAGGRRMEACKKVGIKKVPCNVFPQELTVRESKVVELSENLYRKDFNMKEEISLKKQIYEAKVAVAKESGTKVPSQTEVAIELGESKTNFNADLRLAKAMEVMPEVFEKAKNKHEAHKLLDQAQERAILAEMQKRAMAGSSKVKEEINKYLLDAYILEDAFVGMGKIADSSFRFIEVDPPYGIDYTNVKKKVSLSRTDEYHEVSASEYPEFITKLLTETYRLGADDSYTLLWFGMSWYQTIIDIASTIGYVVHTIPLIWNKVGAQSQNNRPKQRFSNMYETALVLVKGNPTLSKNAPQNVFDFKQVSSKAKIHPTEKPIEMLEKIFSCFMNPNTKMLSPFLGSGNSILAARNVQCHCRGFDLSDDYKKKYVGRVSVGYFKSYVVGE